MFATVSAGIADWHLSSQRTVTLIKSLEDTSQIALASACKGLIFVQLYAMYEYAVRSAVQATLVALAAADVEIKTIHRNLLALVLKSNWDSAADTGRENVWDRRMELIARIDSDELTSTLRDDLFPNDGSHYRIQQLYTIWKIFSVSGPIVSEPRLKGWIEELVENRNAISHGRSRPEEVGRRYSWREIDSRVDDTNAIASHVVSSLESHVQSGGLFAAASPP